MWSGGASCCASSDAQKIVWAISRGGKERRPLIGPKRDYFGEQLRRVVIIRSQGD